MTFWCSTLKPGRKAGEEEGQMWAKDMSERPFREVIKRQVRRSAVLGSCWHCSCRPGKREGMRNVRMPTPGGESLPCISAFHICTSYSRIWLPSIWPEFNWNFRECNHSRLCFAFQHTLPRMPPLPLLRIWCHLTSKVQAWPHFLQPPALWCALSLRDAQAPTPYLYSWHAAFSFQIPSWRTILTHLIS